MAACHKCCAGTPAQRNRGATQKRATFAPKSAAADERSIICAAAHNASGQPDLTPSVWGEKKENKEKKKKKQLKFQSAASL